ncbi:hypothetical protein KFE25_004014 [Diacronema lutheri]|uniref:Uncharacterized protein n=1 Tax=Diacronema lutheri TaxID=2081491 RepID=A0A8J5XE26_DIALT|nr:hypothetical protein KFE25_004014 [Diacronema lutheri]
MVIFKGRVDDMRASRYIATVNLPQSMLDRLAADARVCIEFGPGSTPSALHVDGDTFQLRPTTEELVDCLVEQGGRMLSIGPVHDKIAVVKTSADAARAQAAARAGGHATSAAHLAPDVVVRDESSLRGRGRLAGRQSRGRGRGRQAAPDVPATPTDAELELRARVRRNVALCLAQGPLTMQQLCLKFVAAGEPTGAARLGAVLSDCATCDAAGRYALKPAGAMPAWEERAPPADDAPPFARPPTHAVARSSYDGGERGVVGTDGGAEDDASGLADMPSSPSRVEVLASPPRKRTCTAPTAEPAAPASPPAALSAALPLALHGVRVDPLDPFGSARRNARACKLELVADAHGYERALARFREGHARYLALRVALHEQRDRFDELVLVDEHEDGGAECARLAEYITRDAIEYVVLHGLLSTARDELERARHVAADNL